MVLQKGGNEGGKYIVSFVEMGKISSLISCMKTDGWNERRNHLSQRNKDYQFPGRDEGEAKHFGIKSRLKSEGNGLRWWTFAW